MDLSKRGRRNRARGREGETEIVKLLTEHGIDAVRKASPGDDIRVCGKKAEVKRRKDGFKQFYDWLDKDDARYLFVRADRKKWLAIMPVEELVALLKQR